MAVQTVPAHLALPLQGEGGAAQEDAADVGVGEQPAREEGGRHVLAGVEGGSAPVEGTIHLVEPSVRVGGLARVDGQGEDHLPASAVVVELQPGQPIPILGADPQAVLEPLPGLVRVVARRRGLVDGGEPSAVLGHGPEAELGAGGEPLEAGPPPPGEGGCAGLAHGEGAPQAEGVHEGGEHTHGSGSGQEEDVTRPTGPPRLMPPTAARDRARTIFDRPVGMSCRESRRICHVPVTWRDGRLARLFRVGGGGRGDLVGWPTARCPVERGPREPPEVP